MAEPIEHVIEYFSVRDRFKFEPTVARLEDELRQLSTEYVVWACSLLAHQLAGAGRLNRAFQLSAVDAFVPRMLRSDVQRAITDGQLFIYEDQLLGLTRVAIEVGSDQEVPDLGEEQQKAFFWALALYGDLHSDEFKVHADPYQEMAANAMRGLAASHEEIQGNMLARAHQLWIHLPTLAEFTSLPFFIDLSAEFEHATGGISLVSYLAAMMGLLAHARTAGGQHDPEIWRQWAFDPSAWFATCGNADRAIAATNWLSTDRAGYQKAFTDEVPPEPRLHGLAMLPFRFKPVYRMRNGRAVVLSERFLIEGAITVVYWTVWEHLKKVHKGDEKKLEQLVGSFFERYVVDLLTSGIDADGLKRVFGEAEAIPPEGAPDATLFLTNEIFCVEATKQQLKYIPTLLAADLDQLDADLQRTAEKARQLQDATARVGDGTVRFAGHDGADVLTRPRERLVVVFEPIPRFPVLNDHLYTALVVAGVDYDAFVISIGELEAALVRTDPERLLDLLNKWRTAPDEWELSFHDYLVATGSIAAVDERAPLISAANTTLSGLVRAELAIKPGAGVDPVAPD